MKANFLETVRLLVQVAPLVFAGNVSQLVATARVTHPYQIVFPGTEVRKDRAGAQFVHSPRTIVAPDADAERR